MQTLNPYILQVQSILLQWYEYKYFDYIVVIISALLSFVVGRILHQKKLTILLNMVNNQQKTRKSLNDEIISYDQSIRSLVIKKVLAIRITAIVVIIIIVQIYFFPRHLFINFGVALFIIVCWICFSLRYKYLVWRKTRLQQKFRKVRTSTDDQIKHILAELGQDITKNLQKKFQMEIKKRSDIETMEECKIYKCQNQKNIIKQLIGQYQKILGELKQIKWCDICGSQTNVNAVELKAYIEKIQIRSNPNKNINLSIQRKKQLANSLLQYWNELYKALPLICKRGCSIKVRQKTQQLKKMYYFKIQNLANKLN